MSEGLFAMQSHLNAGVIPTSAEELAQKHQKLMHEYSRLKAQHTVLKKAVKQEQKANATLQSNTKQKEKELRKLQEQLDLLAFHNDRLTKRIEAVQENENKGSHFSLLGGAIKRELEKSNQALDATSVDLAKKIEENEHLHEELSEVNYIYTNHVNGLHAQIADLEKRIEEYQTEISMWQNESRNQANALKQEKAALQVEVERLKKELADKGEKLSENTLYRNEGDTHLQSEVESLRAILLAKVGDIENRDSASATPSLADLLPVTDALRVLEEQAKDYISALGEQAPLKGLPHEIAAKLKLSSATWSDEVLQLAQQLKDAQVQVEQLKKEKDENASLTLSKEQNIKELEKIIDGLQKQLLRQEELERIKQLEKDNSELENRVRQQQSDLEKLQSELKSVIAAREKLEAEINEIHSQALLESFERRLEQKDESHGAGVSKEASSSDKENEGDQEDDDDVFVYTGQDALVSSDGLISDSPEKNDAPESNVSDQTEAPTQSSTPSDTSKVDIPSVQETTDKAITNGDDADNNKDPEHAKEIKHLEAFYESQIQQLKEMLQMTDSKVVRYAKLVDGLKERLAVEDEEKQKLREDCGRLQKEYSKLEEQMSTTESNYQNQLNMMTEYITQLQSQAQR